MKENNGILLFKMLVMDKQEKKREREREGKKEKRERD